MFFIIFLLFLSYNKACYSSQSDLSTLSTTRAPLLKQEQKQDSSQYTNFHTSPPQSLNNTQVVNIPYETTLQAGHPVHKASIQFMCGCMLIVIIVGGIATAVHKYS